MTTVYLEMDKRKPPTPIRIPDDLLAKIKKQAEKENRSVSNMILTIIKKYYGK